MPMQPADMVDIVRNLERRISALERGTGRWGVTYKSDSLLYTLLEINTAVPRIRFWGTGTGVSPDNYPGHPTTLEQVIDVLTLYGLTA